MQRHQLQPGLQAQLSVEVGQRLVHQEHQRLAHDRPGQGNPLALATGELLGKPLQQGLDLQHLRGPLHRLGDLGLRHARRLQREGHVLVDRHVRVQGVVLEHHRHVALSWGP